MRQIQGSLEHGQWLSTKLYMLAPVEPERRRELHAVDALLAG